MFTEFGFLYELLQVSELKLGCYFSKVQSADLLGLVIERLIRERHTTANWCSISWQKSLLILH